MNLEATFTLSWIDMRYKPNKDFFVGGNRYVGRFFFKKMKMLNCTISFTIIDPDDLKQFWTPDIIIDQAKVQNYDDVDGDDDKAGEGCPDADPDGWTGLNTPLQWLQGTLAWECWWC